jgi:hypothetical protein
MGALHSFMRFASTFLVRFKFICLAYGLDIDAGLGMPGVGFTCIQVLYMEESGE